MLEKYAKEQRNLIPAMDLDFAYQRPAHGIATFFGIGLFKPCSGTFGTLGGWLFYLLLEPYVSTTFWFFLILVTLFVGAWASQIAGDAIGYHDHPSIVIDEVVAIWLLMVLVPQECFWYCAAFVTFRFFDIVKCPPVSWIDENCRNGWGVMLDDLVAVVQAGLLMCLLYWIFS